MNEPVKTVSSVEELVDAIDGRMYVAVGWKERVDGGWLELVVNVPAGYRKGVPLFWQACRLFARAAWRNLI